MITFCGAVLGRCNYVGDKGDGVMQPYKVWLFSDLIEKNKRVFKVPVYQRNYDWSNIQCEKLYQDIMAASKRDHKHFTGTIVYIFLLSIGFKQCYC